MSFARRADRVEFSAARCSRSRTRLAYSTSRRRKSVSASRAVCSMSRSSVARSRVASSNCACSDAASCCWRSRALCFGRYGLHERRVVGAQGVEPDLQPIMRLPQLGIAVGTGDQAFALALPGAAVGRQGRLAVRDGGFERALGRVPGRTVGRQCALERGERGARRVEFVGERVALLRTDRATGRARP